MSGKTVFIRKQEEQYEMLISSDLNMQQPDHGRHVRTHATISLVHP